MELIEVVLAVAITLVTGGVAIVLGPKIGLLDIPDDDLKSHTRPVVPLGGAAFLLGLQAGLVMAGAFDPGFLLAAVVLWTMGIVDDVKGLSPRVRLGGATLGGALMAVSSDSSSGPLEAAVLVVAVVVAVNAVNLLDGLDALTGVTASVVFLGLAAYGAVHGSEVPIGALVALGGLVGFLFWNRPPARLFLGDNGAYVMGLTMVWVATGVGSRDGLDLLALALVGVPVLDLGVTIVRRVISRAPLFSGDRRHTYDLLHDRSFSVWSVVGIYAVAQAIWTTVLILMSTHLSYTAAVVTVLFVAMAVTFLTAFALLRRPVLRG